MKRAILKIKNLWISIYTSRALLLALAKKDFKSQFAGSYFGIVWAFIQPLTSIITYWVVFQFGLRAGDVGDIPFVLWLICGIVPWLYFSSAISSASNALLEYGYLVKKVVFNIDILPLVKILSAAFIHFCFVMLAVIVGIFFGFWPSIFILQIPYYLLCMWLLVLGLTLFTSSIMIFFRDLGQIIGIVLFAGMWATPIVWSIDIIPAQYQFIAKLNPLYYIIQGYRNSILGEIWFWQKYNQTMYFWVATLSLIVVGSFVFNRLKPHFADVL